MKYLIIALMLLASCSSEEEVNMANSNGIITAPVRVEDVQQVLGVGSGDVGYLCSNQHGKINKWSKYKPIIHTNISPINLAQMANVYYGIKVPTFVAREIDNSNIITYYPPTGGIASPFRLSDFDQYYHTAVQPFELIFPEKIYYDTPNAQTVAFYFNNNITGWDKNYNINFFEIFHTDYAPFLYMTVIVKNLTSGVNYYITDGKAISEYINDDDPYFTSYIPLTGLKKSDNITVYAALQDTKSTNFTYGLPSGTFFSIELVNGMTKRSYTVAEYIAKDVTAEVAVTLNTTTGRVFIVNSVSITVINASSNIYAKTINIYGDIWEPADTTEDSHLLGSISVSVAANSQKVYTLSTINNATFTAPDTSYNYIEVSARDGSNVLGITKIELNN